MAMTKAKSINNLNSETTNHKGFLLDLMIYISVMFLVREVYFKEVGFLVNGLFWSFSTLIIATWRMKARNISWKDIGLRKPKNIKKTLLISIGVLIATVLSIVFLNVIIDSLPFLTEKEVSGGSSSSKFGNLKGNWLLFFTIMPMVLIESFLEELLDRGFLINWFEKLFSQTSIATILAVLLQAAIFGFRRCSVNFLEFSFK